MKIKTGDFVVWECRPYQLKRFMAEGTVIEIIESTFGGIFKKKGARIRPEGVYKRIFPYRKTTVIGLDKLTHLK